jgi:hypothetical protein
MPHETTSPFEILGVTLEEPTWGLKPQWQFPFSEYSPEINAYEKDWENLELQFRPELDKEARRWVATRKWPQLAPQAEYFFRLRFIAACTFIHQFSRTPNSPFRFPTLAMEEILEWMLIHWWAEIGHSEALYHIEPDPGGNTHSKN